MPMFHHQNVMFKDEKSKDSTTTAATTTTPVPNVKLGFGERAISAVLVNPLDVAKEDYLIDAPESVGDGFSYSGGNYSDGTSKSDIWFKQRKIVKAHPMLGSGEKAKDPNFGLQMGADSQSSTDIFRVYQLKHPLYVYDFVQKMVFVEKGSAHKSSVILIHGVPSQELLALTMNTRLCSSRGSLFRYL